MYSEIVNIRRRVNHLKGHEYNTVAEAGKMNVLRCASLINAHECILARQPGRFHDPNHIRGMSVPDMKTMLASWILRLHTASPCDGGPCDAEE
jgi:hypothetical protein